MHHLFGVVLGQKDLSRAGDLFSLDDSEIEGCLSEALEQIKIISSSPDYQTNDNDQAVVEICITRITTAIRETESIEKHGKSLVALWESCLEHNLKPSGKDEDTPHAKIASDIMSCVLQNYNRPPIMALAVPVAVKFLQRGNRELCRNMSSYLSLAAISKADLLAEHSETIVKSILQGNSMLLRVLPSLYEQQSQPINSHLRDLVALMSHLEQSEQHHLLQLLLIVAKKKQQEALQECIPSLISHLRDPSNNDIILNILIEISGYAPEVLTNFLPTLKEIGDSFPSLIGKTAKIYGAVGLIDEERARICLIYLVNQLANMEHSFHHILLLEIKHITDTFSNILGIQSRDIYRMSNSFTAIAKLLIQQLENDTTSDSRSKSLAFHAVQMKSVHSDSGQDMESGDVTGGMSFTDTCLSQESDKLPSTAGTEEPQLENALFSHPSIKCIESENLPEPVKESCYEGSPKTTKQPVEYQDKLYFHLKENLSKVKAYVLEMGRKIPLPDECVIEDTVRSSVAKLFFSCPLKGHYCLYSKSSFILISRQPQLWIHIMFLFQQNLFPEPLSMQNKSVQALKALWEKTQLKGTHSFETAMLQSMFPLQKDLDHVQIHLEEVRFFDLFGYSEETGAWQCFMCNNPEKATVVNQDGQPLIEGKLKEKQVRWKFIKRWKTRYFTLAGNQLLFRKGKSKDDPDDCPIELSKVQSVKAVAKKRRDRSLPRAFEIFTDSKTYVFKAKDEKNAEEWLQCINVAVAQAKERESREATTYL
ncbi:ventricular zone-expressed PH domain-containing protein homolog 1 isoform X2 [Heteronotia binoei]|uniref:ventricular zone-expressed PH domain-containing protein homolog 1 isoform X2 n=1 Tax=Heteronotia binoei TaxID=13085 RepID=UPI00292FC8A1|nr:ventricular zone-expressed PH domain-containing protein homolog 1 isoform X2 [Heteronotia binoei]